jgi:Ca2+-binding RTX toxin-like protein
MKTWLKRLATLKKSGRHSRKNALNSNHSAPSEILEQRTYLSVSSLVSNSQLIVVADGDDVIEVRSDPGGSGVVQLVANGVIDTSLPSIQASQIESILVDAGPGDNLVDLTGVNSGDFSFVNPLDGSRVRIDVDGGDGADTILGSFSFDDVLIGGDGDDSINTTGVINLGNQTIDGGDGNDIIRGGSGNDLISGRDGADIVFGGAGDDTLTGGDNNDRIDGQDGNDVINGNQGEDTLNGGDNDDTISGDSGDDNLSGGVGNDSLLGGGGNDAVGGNDGNDTLLGNSGNDTLLGGQGVDSMLGGDGDDALDSGERTLTIDDVVIGVEGNSGIQNATFNVTLSAQSGLTVSVDVATVDGTAEAGTDYVSLMQTLTFSPGELTKSVTVQVAGDVRAEFDENFFVEMTNPLNATLQDSFGTATIVDDGDGPTQLVFIDFDSATTGNEIQYSQTVRNGIQARLEEDLGIFNVSITQIRPTSGLFNTVLVNAPPSGGLADEIDFRNLNQGGNATVDLNGFLGGFFNPPQTNANLVNLTAGYIAHEVGHLLGLRHSDAWGPIGSGISPGTPNAFVPTFTGPIAATETNLHLMGSGAATGSTIFDEIQNQYFGARSAVKLSMFTVQGQVLQESSVQHNTLLSAQGITLADLAVPNTEVSGALAGLQFDVEATSVIGQLGAASELDLYEFTATQGQLLNLEVMSTAFGGAPSQRFPDLVDSQVRILDSLGNQLAFNQDGADSGFVDPDSIIIDFTVPLDGNYFVEVSAQQPLDVGGYELFMYTFAATQPLTPTQTGIIVSTDGNIMDGGAGSDSLGGGLGDDILIGGLDDDLIFGNDGNDSIYGGAGADTINGDAGNDLVYGQGGRDIVEGGADDDFVDGGTSFDIVYGDDSLGTTTGNDTVVGGSQNDSVFGGDGDDFLFGGGGRDTLDGGLGNDSVFGQAGNDLVRGGGGVDELNWKGDGNDTFESSGGLDTIAISATNGSDTYTIGQDGSTFQIATGGKTLSIPNLAGDLANPIEQIELNLGAGDDVVTIGDINNVGATVLRINGEEGNDRISGAGSTLGNVRLLIDGGTGDDDLTGTNGGDTIVGGDGDDEINGQSGNDTISGGAGDDDINAGAGDDFVRGDSDNDNIVGADGDDTLDGGVGNDVINGDNGRDSITGGFGDDSMIGGSQADFISGDTGEDTLIGAGGNDTLDGGRNDDVILGNSGSDVIRGDHGDDTIVAHRGDDTIDGGDGDDMIMAGDGNDAIVAGDGDDFVSGDGGDDTITGNDGDDSLLGGGGNDIILGGDGDDVIGGNAGMDTLSGGEGANAIVDAVGMIDENFVLTTEMLANLDASD